MSFVSLKKTVDQRSKDTIFGYIREVMHKSYLHNIPVVINYMCLNYYFMIDFKTYGDSVILSTSKYAIANNNIKDIIKTKRSILNQTVFGNYNIDSSHVEYIWRFKMKCFLNIPYHIKIGIDTSDKRRKHSDYSSEHQYQNISAINHDNCFYCFDIEYDDHNTEITPITFDGDSYQQTDTYQFYDIERSIHYSTLILNTKDKTLKFFINGYEFYETQVIKGISVNNDIIYHLFISLEKFHHSNSIQLIEFETSDT